MGQTLKIDKSKIDLDAQWDGLHGIISNNMDISPEKLLSSYRSLWRIEKAFRVNKSDLKMRPIHHWTPERIKSHILICYTSFAVSHFTMLKINSVRKLEGRSEMSIPLVWRSLHKLRAQLSKMLAVLRIVVYMFCPKD